MSQGVREGETERSFICRVSIWGFIEDLEKSVFITRGNKVFKGKV